MNTLVKTATKNKADHDRADRKLLTFRANTDPRYSRLPRTGVRGHDTSEARACSVESPARRRAGGRERTAQVWARSPSL